jgi:hypothetical protein
MVASEYSWEKDLSSTLQTIGANVQPDLHLSVSLRSFRAENLSNFVALIVSGNASEASALRQQMPNYPFLMTRDLECGRAWLSRQARGSVRYGVLASSNALRLKPEGIHVKQKIEPENWFLKGKDDIRSSFYLEDVATEFDIQGLELDWALVCWDANFRRVNGKWAIHDFSGTRWQNVRDEAKRRYVANAYRVLLTRARQGLVIFVPRGDPDDPTRAPEFYDGVYDFLIKCGVEEIQGS